MSQLGGKKLHNKLQSQLFDNGVKCGRDKFLKDTKAGTLVG
jgi:hypothetical protein